MTCTCGLDEKENYEEVISRLREGLVSYEEGALLLNTSVSILEKHFRTHVKHITARQMEKIIVKVKSDLLDTYDSLSRTLKALDKSTDLAEIKIKIDLSKEIRALKKDINEFISKHSTRLALDHQNLETQWKMMEEFLLYDACKSCKAALGKHLLKQTSITLEVAVQ